MKDITQIVERTNELQLNNLMLLKESPDGTTQINGSIINVEIDTDYLIINTPLKAYAIAQQEVRTALINKADSLLIIRIRNPYFRTTIIELMNPESTVNHILNRLLNKRVKEELSAE